MEQNHRLRDELIRTRPDMSNQEIATATGYSVAWVCHLRSELKAKEERAKSDTNKRMSAMYKFNAMSAVSPAQERMLCAHFLEDYAGTCDYKTRTTLAFLAQVLKDKPVGKKQKETKPQAANKPLTDDEVVALFNKLVHEKPAWPERRYRDFARYVEKAHGIGGEE